MLPFNRLDEIRAQRPLLHCISNIVAANDCANLALAVGAGPIMAQAPEETAEITASSHAVVINTGTPSEDKFLACLHSGQSAQKLGKPAILDPVGIGASTWRLEHTEALLAAFTPSILRVNLSEAQTLLHLKNTNHGVDSPSVGLSKQRQDCAVSLALRLGTVVLLTGEDDLITDGTRLFRISGGSDEMTRVTGTGCMLSVLCGAFSSVEPDGVLAAALASALWKLCSIMAQTESSGRGVGSFRTALLDAASHMDGASFAEAISQGIGCSIECVGI